MFDAKHAQTTVRDFGGGMEDISATTQTDNMIHDARTELDQTSDGLQSHELAHQRFGDYLTCRSWSDTWMNESFATNFQAMWDEPELGGDDGDPRRLAVLDQMRQSASGNSPFATACKRRLIRLIRARRSHNRALPRTLERWCQTEVRSERGCGIGA